MTGIPYCWGGFNGIDAVSSGIYSTSFLNAITRTASIHTRTCTVCGYEDELEHTWSYEQNSATTHIRTCTLCGYRAAARHSNYKTGISATEHVVICGYCRYSVPENHTFTYPSYTTPSHTKKCSGCGYSTTETHSYTYTSLSSTTHKKACTKCNYSVSQSHTNTNRYNTTHHWYGCIYCSYAINKEAHLMLQGSCLTCAYYEGAPLNGADLPEEPSTEPPVSDEPFVVLCVPHEDKLFERIRR